MLPGLQENLGGRPLSRSGKLMDAICARVSLASPAGLANIPPSDIAIKTSVHKMFEEEVRRHPMHYHHYQGHFWHRRQVDKSILSTHLPTIRQLQCLAIVSTEDVVPCV